MKAIAKTSKARLSPKRARAFLDTSVELSQLYRQRFLDYNCRTSGDIDQDPWCSLKFFVFYAFERQGRAADYPAAAADTIASFAGSPFHPGIAREVWNEFAERLEHTGLNYSNNPMCPSGIGYTRNYKKERRNSKTWKSSAIEIAASLNGQPIVAWARDAIRSGRTAEAHERLRGIGGIDYKIASFFLRDVASLYDLSPTSDRHLLQPIDVWVRFVGQQCGGGHEMDDAACARFIVQLSDEPEKLNQGIWYFCAEVAWSSRYRVKRCMRDASVCQQLIEAHLEDLRRGCDGEAEFRRARSEGNDNP